MDQLIDHGGGTIQKNVFVLDLAWHLLVRVALLGGLSLTRLTATADQFTQPAERQ